MRNAERLDRALAGEGPVTPAVAELVEFARGLEKAWTAVPSTMAAKHGLTRALDAFEGNGQVVSLRPELSRGRRFAASTAAAVAALVAIPGIARAASEDALPGEFMYGVKIGFEQVRVNLADNPAEEATIHLALSGERLDEAVLSAAFGQIDAEREAILRYAMAIEDFGANLGQARALGLDVAVLVSQSEALLEEQNEVLAALMARPGDPAVPGIKRAIEAIQRAKAKGHGPPAHAKNDDKGGNAGKGKGPPAHAGKEEKDKGGNAGGSSSGQGNQDDAPGKQDDPPSGGQGQPDQKPKAGSHRPEEGDDDDEDDGELDDGLDDAALTGVAAGREVSLDAQGRENPGKGRLPKWHLAYLFRTRI